MILHACLRQAGLPYDWQAWNDKIEKKEIIDSRHLFMKIYQNLSQN
jgi:hypothetical protein